MASDKRRHKDAKIAREKQTFGAEGARAKKRDLRWKGGITADQGLKDKMAQLMPDEYLRRSSDSE